MGSRMETDPGFSEFRGCLLTPILLLEAKREREKERGRQRGSRAQMRRSTGLGVRRPGLVYQPHHVLPPLSGP